MLCLIDYLPQVDGLDNELLMGATFDSKLLSNSNTLFSMDPLLSFYALYAGDIYWESLTAIWEVDCG